MVTLSLVALWLLVQVFVLGGLSMSRAQDRLYGELRTELAAATAPTGGIITPGAPVAVLRLSGLGRTFVVVEGTSAGDLRAGPGHRRDSVLPGQAGVAVVYGRARAYGGPFARLPDLLPGDEIVTRTAQGRSRYVVDQVRRAGDPVPSPPRPGHGRLTLVTAEARSFLAADQVLYVDATLTTRALPSPGGLLAAVPDSERALGTDGAAALPLVVVGLGGLVGLVVLATLARYRWPATVVWLVFAPVCAALAWSTSDTVMRLLPNLV